MSRIKFCLYIFGPVALGYVLPLIFYEWPIKILTEGAPNEIKSINLSMAILACVVWFGIAIFLISYPYHLSVRETRVRYWNGKALWAGFLCFSVFGCFFAILHRLFLMPEAIEQLIHQLSYMPTIGFILGLCCLQDLDSMKPYMPKKILAFSLMGLNVLIVFALPIILGWVWPVVISAVAILFGMSVIGVGPARQLLYLGIYGLFILGGLSIKEEFRILMCEGACERVSIKKVFQERFLVELAKRPDLPQGEKLPSVPKFLRGLENQEVELVKKPRLGQGREQTRKDEFLKTLETQKKVFESGYDPNYNSIRFIPPQLENSLPHFFVAKLLRRINYLGQLGYVIQTTGDRISYSYGQTYFPILTKFIPRLLWSEKPQENVGQFFGHRYRFLQDKDLTTSVNLPLIVEGYLNWGWFGIVFSAMLVGVVLRLLWELWIGESGATGNVILGMIVVMTMMGQESNLSLLLGGLLYGGLVYWCIEVLFRKWFGTKLDVEPTH